MVPKNVFYVPKFAPCQLLLKLSGWWSIDSEIGFRELLFLGRLLTGDKMAPVVRNLFQIRSQSYSDVNIVSLGVLPSISEALHKYGLFSYFDSWLSDSVFPTYSQWKSIVKAKIRKSEVNTWKNFVIANPSYKLVETCLYLVSPQMFWSISNQYPDLVTRLHVHIGLMGNFGFSACVPWTIRSDESLCFVCMHVCCEVSLFGITNNAYDHWYNKHRLWSCPVDMSGPMVLLPSSELTELKTHFWSLQGETHLPIVPQIVRTFLIKTLKRNLRYSNCVIKKHF